MLRQHNLHTTTCDTSRIASYVLHTYLFCETEQPCNHFPYVHTAWHRPLCCRCCIKPLLRGQQPRNSQRPQLKTSRHSPTRQCHWGSVLSVLSLSGQHRPISWVFTKLGELFETFSWMLRTQTPPHTERCWVWNEVLDISTTQKTTSCNPPNLESCHLGPQSTRRLTRITRVVVRTKHPSAGMVNTEPSLNGSPALPTFIVLTNSLS